MSETPSVVATPAAATPAASAPASTPSTSSTPAAQSQPANPAAPAAEPAAVVADPAKPAEPAKVAEPAKAEPAKPEHVDLLNDPKFKQGDKPATDPTKNADGTDKTPEQIEADKKTAEDAEKEKAEKKDGEAEKPIEYEDFKLPEDAVIPETIKGKLTDFAKENKLSQEQAQAIVDLGVEQNQANLDFFVETKARWRGECEKDPIIGGQKLAESVNNANDIVRRFGSDPALGGDKQLFTELQDDLMMLGLGNKRSFVRFMNNIHKATAEDKVLGQGGGGEQPKTMAQRMYPDQPSESAKV